MALTKINRDFMMDNVSTELAGMFDRLTNQYSGGKNAEELLLLPEIERSFEAGFLEYCLAHATPAAEA